MLQSTKFRLCVWPAISGVETRPSFRDTRSPQAIWRKRIPGSLTSEIAIQHWKSPKSILYGEDVIRLSKEESAKHWLSVAGDGANEETSSDVEDIREQILQDESMNIPSPAGDNEQIKRIQDTTEKVDARTNTECTKLDDIAATVIKTHEEVRSMNSQMVDRH